MKFKVEIMNELPFMINLPTGDYRVRATINGVDKVLTLNLSEDVYKLHISPFPNRTLHSFYEGKSEELQRFVMNKQIPNYAFEPLKSYIKCIVEEEHELTQQMFDEITKDKLIERLKTLILEQKGNKNIDASNLSQLSEEEYTRMDKAGQLDELKTNYLINKIINELSNQNVAFYYIALNNFIKQYSYFRKDFFVEPLTIHTLEGTYYTQYVDDQYYQRIKRAGKVPTIITHKQWLPDLEEIELINIKQRMELDAGIPAVESLLLVARNLAERGEYRSAVIESSAALEVVVEQKIVEKMLARGRTQSEIDNYLHRTETKFYERCDLQLRVYTGQSFVNDNSILWTTINTHRKSYRHKIAHSTIMPDDRKTEEIINDFETAIRYIQSL